MARSTFILALVTSACVTSAALAQTSSPPRNDLSQPYRTTRDWGELAAGMKWAAVTSVEAAADGSIFVIHRCFANCRGVDAQGNAYGAVVRRHTLERHVKK
jgi:hypothetical protein